MSVEFAGDIWEDLSAQFRLARGMPLGHHAACLGLLLGGEDRAALVDERAPRGERLHVRKEFADAPKCRRAIGGFHSAHRLQVGTSREHLVIVRGDEIGEGLAAGCVACQDCPEGLISEFQPKHGGGLRFRVERFEHAIEAAVDDGGLDVRRRYRDRRSGQDSPRGGCRHRRHGRSGDPGWRGVGSGRRGYGNAGTDSDECKARHGEANDR